MKKSVVYSTYIKKNHHQQQQKTLARIYDIDRASIKLAWAGFVEGAADDGCWSWGR